ncbi:hypothetical protein DACRYDRAFT_106775 [Dacryopinax primogenitus]|uniref:Uncharacterized protein n=1 Tax=Dacryopinax primogenitus (strain DJM 731) TaxID=1858805 RepID=M5GDV3_DACPD|nr:uncharacterized protein DACRYDRAFT_106775 [Dacryopinax primogenitus]EJU02713.1 hypothetical protein DACRYDRAFT_106775 [Dacryopinax primogenitus]
MSSRLNEFLTNEDIRKEVVVTLSGDFQVYRSMPSSIKFLTSSYYGIYDQLEVSAKTFKARFSSTFLKSRGDMRPPLESIDASAAGEEWKEFMLKTFFQSKAEPKADDVIAAIQHPFIVAEFCKDETRLRRARESMTPEIKTELANAFETSFQNDEIRKAFIQHLKFRAHGIMEDVVRDRRTSYSRCLNIIASSGQGKSRLMKEVGYGRRDCIPPTPEDEPVFCIPINMRELDAPGWPLTDAAVLKYFETLKGDSEDTQQSVRAHWRAAVFISEALEHALTCLKNLLPEAGWREEIENPEIDFGKMLSLRRRQ